MKENNSIEIGELENKDVTGEVVEDAASEELAPVAASAVARPAAVTEKELIRRRLFLRYLLLPFLFLTVALLGGLRIDGADRSLIFLKPSLLCLILAIIMLTLFFRSGLVQVRGWFGEDMTTLKNAANISVLITLFAASSQLFNSLLPEQGIPFWIVAFCFFWTLWNNLFADFDTKKLLRSLGALFGLAFVTKYLILANLAAPAGKSWFEALTENPGQEAVTRLLDLPRFAASTGYIQFFAAARYLFGLFLLPSTPRDEG